MEDWSTSGAAHRQSHLEIEIARLLTVGSVLSTAVLVAGLGIWIALGPDRAASSLLHLGLILLMGTPVARVVLSFVVSLRQRDWFLAAATFAVLIVLAASLLVARAAIPDR